MAEKAGPSIVDTLPAMVTAFVIVGGLLWYLVPLNSSRPGGKPGPAEPTLSYQNVEARLWQDPFEAVADHEADVLKASDLSLAAAIKKMLVAKSNTHALSLLSKQVAGLSRVTMMPVLCEAGRYAETAEARRRARYAVVSALVNRKFIPIDSQHIGYIFLDDWPGLDKWSRPGTFAVPYEWYSSTANGQYVLVLWLDEAAFADRPLARLGRLVRLVRNELTKGANSPAVDVTLLGPRTSTLLRSMILELNDLQGMKPPATPPTAKGEFEARGASEISILSTAEALDLAGARMFSSTATAEQHILMEAKAGQGTTDSFECLFNKVIGVTFERTIATDDVLARALVDELARRGVHPRSGDRLALVSEWDTFYGRSLPRLIKSAIGNNLNGPGKEWTNQTIYSASYQRGIDGMLPGDEERHPVANNGRSSAAGDAVTGGQAARKAAADEVPEGQNQYDYLRRMADNLAAWDRQARSKPLDGGLRAVGVLGSDVYDKLLILQALRPRFPGVVFFTTDLDAGMGMGDQQKWTHNLIVASAFGLQLDHKLQGDIPSFRDAYQTSLFCTTLKALGEPDLDKNAIGSLPVRIFEIGRDGPFDISPVPEGVQGDGSSSHVHPTSQDDREWWNGTRGWSLFSAILLTAFLLIRLFTDVNSPSRQDWSWLKELLRPATAGFLLVGCLLWIYRCTVLPTTSHRVLQALCAAPFAIGAIAILIFLFIGDLQANPIKYRVYVSTAVLAVLYWETVIVFSDQTGKPFVLFDGISIWPTEAIRTASILLSVHFLIRSINRLRRSERDLAKRYQLHHPDQAGVHPYKSARCWGLHIYYLGKGVSRYRRSSRAWARKYLKHLVASARLPQGNPRNLPARLQRLGGLLIQAVSWCWKYFAAAAQGSAPAAARRAKRPRVRNRIRPARCLWKNHLTKTCARARQQRSRWMVVAYMAIGCSMYLLFGLPSAPIRGGLSKWADYLMLALTVLALAVLTFYVVDTAHYAEKLIRHLAFHQTSWPPECLEKKVEQRGMPPEDLEEYTTVRFIAKLTHPIMPLIYYPFIILTLMILARMRVFDNWDWPPALILIYTLNSALAVFSAARLRRAAEEGRRRIVRRLRQKLILIGDISKSERAKRLSATIDEIVAIREGAFISMSQNPVIGALMLPSGAGLLVVIQYLAKGF